MRTTAHHLHGVLPQMRLQQRRRVSSALVYIHRNCVPFLIEFIHCARSLLRFESTHHILGAHNAQFTSALLWKCGFPRCPNSISLPRLLPYLSLLYSPHPHKSIFHPYCQFVRRGTGSTDHLPSSGSSQLHISTQISPRIHYFHPNSDIFTHTAQVPFHAAAQIEFQPRKSICAADSMPVSPTHCGIHPGNKNNISC